MGTSMPGPPHWGSRQPPFAEQSVRQQPVERKRRNRFSSQSDSIVFKSAGISDLRNHVYPLRYLCDSINRKEDWQRVRILRCESYTEGIAPPHIYLVLSLCYDRRGDNKEPIITFPNAWLRLDRRRGEGSMCQFIRALGRTPANDKATFAGKKGGVTQLDIPGNRQQFEPTITLRDLGIILKFVHKQLVHYKLFWDNCWAFSSIIEDCLHTLYKSTFTIGHVRNRWIANGKREYIRALALAMKDATPDVNEATIDLFLRQEREAKAGVFSSVIDALLESYKQQPRGFRRPPAPPQRVARPFVSGFPRILETAAHSERREADPLHPRSMQGTNPYFPTVALPLALPIMLSLEPNTGPMMGGIDIIIRGSNFNRKHTCFFGKTGVVAVRQDRNTLRCEMPPRTEPGPVYVALDRPMSTVRGSAIRQPDNAVVFTYEGGDPLQETLTILQSCTHKLKGHWRLSATALRRQIPKWTARETPLTLDPSTINVEYLATEVVILAEEKEEDAQDPEFVSKSLLRPSSKSNRTLLHLSAVLGFDELLGSVISHEVDLNQPDTSGYTPLHYAALHGHRKTAELLVQHGASVEIPDHIGRLAENVAKDSGNYAVQGILMEQRMNVAAAGNPTASTFAEAPAPHVAEPIWEHSVPENPTASTFAEAPVPHVAEPIWEYSMPGNPTASVFAEAPVPHVAEPIWEYSVPEIHIRVRSLVRVHEMPREARRQHSAPENYPNAPSAVRVHEIPREPAWEYSSPEIYPRSPSPVRIPREPTWEHSVPEIRPRAPGPVQVHEMPEEPTWGYSVPETRPRAPSPVRVHEVPREHRRPPSPRSPPPHIGFDERPRESTQQHSVPGIRPTSPHGPPPPVRYWTRPRVPEDSMPPRRRRHPSPPVPANAGHGPTSRVEGGARDPRPAPRPAPRPSRAPPAPTEAEQEHREIYPPAIPVETRPYVQEPTASTSASSYMIPPSYGRERPSRQDRVSERPARRDASQSRPPQPLSGRYEVGERGQKEDDQAPRKRSKKRRNE